MSDLNVVEPVATHQITVNVSYNGLLKEFKAAPTSTVNELLQRALHEFHIADRPHIVSLFNEAGQELADASSLHDAGVKDHATLLLRPSTVKGGSE